MLESAIAGIFMIALSCGAGADPPVALGDRAGDVEIISCPASPPVTLLDGRVLITDAGKAVARYSKDSGISWSDPQPIIAPVGDGEDPACTIPLLVSRSGAIHFFGYNNIAFDFNDRAKSRSQLFYCRSTDGGTSRSPMQRMPMGRFAYTGAVNSAIQLSSGRILVPLSVLSDRTVGAFVSVALYSDDDGLTWNPPVEEISINTGASGWYESGAVEPVALELKDGRVWMLIRAQDGFQWESFSSDGGLRWTPPRHTRFISNQSAMAVLRLRDGRIMLFWNNCGADGLGEVHWTTAERAVLSAALSDDEGETWVGYREVARVAAKGQDVGYPFATQAPDGGVLICAGNGPMFRIYPDFLTRTTFMEDFTQSIGRWSVLAAEGAEVINDPYGGSTKVMRLAKPNAGKPAAACLNFPFGSVGELTVTVRIEPGFQGVHCAVIDNYDLPGLPRDGCFPFRIVLNPQGEAIIQITGSRGSWLDTPGTLNTGAWHDLTLKWDCGERRAALYRDTQEIAVIEQYICAPGLAYLRLRSLAANMDTVGILVRSVKVSVSNP